VNQGITSLERIKRYSKPYLSASRDGPARKVVLSIGRAADLEPSDIIHAITAAAGFDGEVVRNVRMLERFTFVGVPEQETERVVAQLSGSEPAGRPVALESVRG
jgi:ATP-dependent RNA helicase DeaD